MSWCGCYSGPGGAPQGGTGGEVGSSSSAHSTAGESNHGGSRGDDGAATDGGTSSGASELDSSGGSPEVDPWTAACPWIANKTYTYADGPVFEPDQIVEIELEMAESDYDFQLENPDLEEYRPATVIICGERVEGAAMRFKKSTLSSSDLEEGYAKNPILIDFSEFTPGQRLRGLRHLDLEYGGSSAFSGDFFLVAERLNWELLNQFGRPTSRVNYVKLSVNGDRVGLFLNVERIDKSYLTRNFGENDGNLYKHAYCGGFEYEGPNASDYGPLCYEKKTNEMEADYSDVINLADVLTNTPDSEYPTAVPAVLNVEDMMPLAAALQAIAYLDTFVSSRSNYFTYFPPGSGRAEIIPWDLDGGFFQDQQPCGTVDSVNVSVFVNSPCEKYGYAFLINDRLLEHEAWRDTYLETVRDFVVGPFDPGKYAARVEELRAVLAPALAEDPNRDSNDADWEADLDVLVTRQAQRAEAVRAELMDEGIDVP